MVFLKKDYNLFLMAVKRHNLQPMLREIQSTISGSPATLYEVIGLDKITEFILEREMEDLRNDNKL